MALWGRISTMRLRHRSYDIYYYYYYYYHINVDSTFLEDGLTDHDETFRDYGGWLPGEYPRCDDVIDHTIYIIIIIIIIIT